MNKIFELAGKISIDSKAANMAMENIDKKAKSASKSIGAFGKNMQNAGKKITGVGKGLSMKVTAPILGIGTAAALTYSKFADSMSNVQAISGATGEELSKLEDMARNLGSTTAHSASAAADAMSYLALAGWDTNQILAATPDMLNLASAAGMDLSNAADIVTDTMSAFQMQAEEAGRAADVFAKTSASANTNVEQLGEAMKYAAPVANSFGASLETTSAIAGRMADAGIKGSQAGTALRAGFLRLASPTEDAADLLETLSIRTTDSEGNMRDIVDIMQDMEHGMKDLSEAQRIEAMQTIFGTNAMAGWMAVLDGGVDNLKDLEKEIYNSSGTAKDMAETMEDNLGGSMRALKSAAEGLKITLGKALAPTIRNVAEFLSNLALRFSSLDDRVVRIIAIVGAVVAAIGPLLMIFGTMITAIGKLVAIKGVLVGAVGALLSPVGLVIAAIAGLIAGLIYLIKTNDDIVASLKELWTSLVEFFVGAFNFIKDAIFTFIGWLKQWVEDNRETLDAIKSAFVGFIESIIGIISGFASWATDIWEKYGDEILSTTKSIFTATLTVITTVIHAIIELIKGVIDWVSNWVNDNRDKLDTLKELFINMLASIRGFIEAFVEWAKEFWQKYGEDIIEISKKSLEIVKEAFNIILNQIVDIFKTVISIITNIFNVFTAVFTGDWSLLWESVKNLFEDVWGLILRSMGRTLEALLNLFGISLSDMLETTVNGLTAVRDFFVSIFENIRDTIMSIVDAIVGGIRTALSGIMKTIETVMGAFNKAREATSNIGGAVKGGVSKVVGGVRNIIPGLADGGTVTSRGATLVGEEGPEILDLPKGSRVTPLDKQGGDLTNNFNIDNITVRNDNDIKLIARELFNLQKATQRGVGIA